MTMPKKRLIKPTRDCVCCDRSATPRARIAGQPNIVSISFVIYFRGASKSVLKNAPRVRICSECLAGALAAPSFGGSPTHEKFAAAVRQSLSASYSDILATDALDQVHRPVFDAAGILFEGGE